jgi:serine/threonine-protein kinase
VKPENILLTADGGVKVADFGLSRTMAESRATQAGVLMGTAHYLAPEQVEGDASDHRSDIYALGVVLYEMLTGETPFTGDNPLVIAYQRVRNDVAKPSTRIGGVPPALDAVVARATARDAGNRFASAAEMGEALRAATPRSDTGEVSTLVHPTTAIPIGTHETIQLKRKRAPRLTRRGIIVIAALLVAVLASIPLLTGVLAHVDVPNVTGKTKADAQGMLEKAGFKVTTETENHASIPTGVVIRTDPVADTSARKGSTITMIVSAGPVTVQVPNVRGLPFADAEKQLQDRGLEVVKVEEFSATVAKGLVIDQDHDPNVIVTQNTPVTLTVSKGKERIAVPDVSGKTEADATQILSSVGFKIVVERKDHDTVPAGSVIDQSPKKGVKADKGSEVKIVVSNGPPKVSVPNILCMTRTQAAHTIAAAGLKIEFVGTYSRVVDQSPPPGSTAPRGSTVKAYTAPGGASCS